MNKFLILYLIYSVLLFISVNAMSIDEQISQIKDAPPQERVKLMNKFKQNLANMNNNQRADAIKVLREKMNQKHNNVQMDEHYSVHQEVQSAHLIPQMQMRESEHISAYQNMNNMQAGDQFSHSDNTLQMQPNYQKQPDNQKQNFMKRR